MNSKERFIAAIEKDGVDRVPIGPPFQGYWALEQANLSVCRSIENPRLAAEAQMHVLSRCEFDGIETIWDWLAPVEALGCPISMPDVGNPSTVASIVADREAFEKMEQPDPSRDYRMKSGMETTRMLMDKIGNERFLYMELVCPFTLVGEIRGVERLMLDLYDDPRFVLDMLKFTTETIKIYVEYMMSSGIDGIFLCDPTASADLISKEDFITYSQPFLNDAVKAVRAEGGYSMVHICGNTSDRLDHIADLRSDVFSVDFLVDMGYAKEKIGKRQTFLGNINPAETLFTGTREDAIKESVECIQKTGGIGHILGAGCDIAPGTPIENVEVWKMINQLP